MKREKAKHKQTKTKNIPSAKPTAESMGILRFKKYISKYTVLILVVIVSIIGLIAFGDFLLIKNLFFFLDIGSDSINQDLPLLINKSEYLNNNSFINWSFFQGMGGQFYRYIPIEPLGFVSYTISYVGYKLFGSNFFIYGRFIRIFIFHFIFTAIIFYYYLRTISISKYVAFIGTLLISFSGYLVLGSSWGFSGQVFGAVFLLFAFEQLFVKKRCYFFPLAIVYVSGNPFVLYIYALFMLTYSLFRYFSFAENKLKGYFALAGKMIGLGSLGLLMNSINTWKSFSILFFSPRISGNSSLADELISGNSGIDYTLHNSTTLLRFFSNDILGSGTNFKGWNNYFEAPTFYIGILSLLLFSQVFTLMKKRQLVIFGGFIGFWLISVIFPEIRYAILAYTGDYYRYGYDFIIPFILLFSAVYSLNKISDGLKLNYYTLAGTLIFLLVILYYPYQNIAVGDFDSNIRSAVTLLLLTYAGIVFLISKPKYKAYAQVALVILITVELSYFSYKSYSDRESITKIEYKKEKGGYADGSINAVNYIKSIDNSLFYRIEKDYQSGNAIHGSLNDALAQGYYGTASYSSFNQINYVRFLEETGLIQKGDETATRWLTGLRGYPLLQTFGNVKYHLSKSEAPEFLRLGFDSLAHKNGITVLKNKYYLPFGYTYDKYIDAEDFKTLVNYQITPQSLSTIYTDLSRAVEAQSLKIIIDKLQTILNIKYSNLDLFSEELENVLGKDIASMHLTSITKYSVSNFRVQTALLNGFVYEKDNHINIDELEKINLTDSSKIIPVTMFNFDVYKSITDNLKQDTLQITSFKQSEILGNIRLSKAKMLFLTIPYDKGWKVKVNDKEKELSRVNFGFTGIVLPKGEHKIELYYVPEYSQITNIVSLTSVIGFWLFLGFFIYRKKKQVHKVN